MKITKMQPDEPESRHPEDIAAENDGREYAAKYAGEFFDAHKDDFAQLVSTYSDYDAKDLLDHLRELFWSLVWNPKETKS